MQIGPPSDAAIPMTPDQIISRRYPVTEEEALSSLELIQAAHPGIDPTAALEIVAKLASITGFTPVHIAAVFCVALTKGYDTHLFTEFFETHPVGLIGRKLLWFAHSYGLPMRSIFDTTTIPAAYLQKGKKIRITVLGLIGPNPPG